MRESSRTPYWAGIAAAICCFDLSTAAQTPLNLESLQPRDRIIGPINDRIRVTLPGNRHPMARARYDTGAADPETRLDRMILELGPDVSQQQALDTLLEQQQDPQSPLYHRWLTPESFGRAFGVSDHDLQNVVGWLEANGFAVEPVPASRNRVIFSGTAAQANRAFHTGIRRYLVNGELHLANVTDPQIPQTLAGVVSGIVSLHDFRSQPQHAWAIPAPLDSPEFSSGGTHYLAPADFATIYDLGPLYGGSTDGTGQSIAIVGRSNIPLADVQTFRSRMGLSAQSPTVILNGTDPGVLTGGEQMEAELDVEWAGAVAKNAAIQFVVSASTATTDGVDLSAQYIVSHNLAPVISLSFGNCETAMGAAENQFWKSLWQQAAAQGMSVFVASGDSGAAGCDSASANSALYGRGVNGLCSTPYSTCVGGTEFSDTTNPALYWSSANNASTWGSALTYIPEAAWNESGASAGSGLWATGGGASILYPKPAWQTGRGVPADGQRDVPDVALNAAGHDAYLVYMNGGFYAVSGTSAATPSFAGIGALVAQRQGGRLGNCNPTLYTLASRQVLGGAAVFHDVISGSNSVPGLNGYSAGPGYDLVTGLGSVDANQLVNSWGAGSTPIPALRLTGPVTALSVVQGKSATSSWTVSISGGFQSAVTLSAGTLPSGLTAALAPASLPSPGSGASTLTLTAGAKLAPGAYNLVLTASGGGISTTANLAVTVVSNCPYVLNPTSASLASTAGNYSVALGASTGCAWTASSSASWITLTSGTTGSGSGTIGYSVSANTTSAARFGSLSIAGQTFAVTQAGAAATTLGSTSANATAAGGNGTVVVNAATPTSTWTAVSNDSWIAITSGASGMGSQRVMYNVAANSATTARTGTMTIAGLTFTVNQAGNGCSYKITLGPLAASPSGATGSIAIGAPSSCAWTAVSNVPWVTIRSGASGNGNGTVTIVIAPNQTGKTETGTLMVAGYTITVTVGITGSAEMGEPVLLP